jgi:branched-chain amino acid transport system ATP-binding protein
LLLEVKNAVVCYDTAMILDDVSIQVDQREFVSMVGPNGAGKTTLLRLISGLTNWEREITRGMRKEVSNIILGGEVLFKGEKIDNLPAHERARRGLILCPERGRPFRELTVLDNLRCASYLIKDKKKEQRNLEKVYELFPVLKAREKQVSGTLSGGERTMLAIGRALMHDPELLLIDEPSTGLAPTVKEEMFARIGDIFQAGVTILLVEQDVSFALDLGNRNYVLSRGKIVAEATGKELLADEKIRKIYLGL